MWKKIIDRRVQRLNALYHHDVIRGIDISATGYTIYWSEGFSTAYKGTPYECYQFMRAFEIERRVRVRKLPVYHSRPMHRLRRILSAFKPSGEGFLDVIAVFCIMVGLFGLSIIL